MINNHAFKIMDIVDDVGYILNQFNIVQYLLVSKNDCALSIFVTSVHAL